MSRIFLKNLPNWTTREILISKFSSFGTITDIKLIKGTSSKGKMLGFIGFYEKKSSFKVLKNANFFFLKDQKIFIEKAYPKTLDLPYRKEKKEKISNLNGEKILFKNIFETGILLVQNLPYKIPDSEIRKLFLPFGFITDIFKKKRKPKEKNLLQIFVEFGLPECAIKAASFLDGKIFHGRILHILPFQGKNKNSKKEKKEFLFLKFKRLKEEMDKKEMNYQRSWYTLFIPQEKIVKILSLKYGKEKPTTTTFEKFQLNLTKLSLSEARIQNEISLFFKYYGINMNAFNPDLIHKKSRRTLLFKNLAFEKKFNSKKLLRKFGKISQFIFLPIIKFILIEYQKKKDAREAFNFFQKIKLKQKNILMEWAPLNSFILKKNFELKKKRKKSAVSNTENLILFKGEKNSLLNSNKETTDKAFFQKNFTKSPDVSPQKVFKFNPKANNKILVENPKKTGKILVRNIPFELTLFELKKIYETFGQILSIRLPKKSPKQHKGFAFVEFKKIEEAKKAVLSTQNVHIYSRHLSVNLLKNS